MEIDFEKPMNIKFNILSILLKNINEKLEFLEFLPYLVGYKNSN